MGRSKKDKAEADPPTGQAVDPGGETVEYIVNGEDGAYPSSQGKQIMACGCGATRFLLLEHIKLTAEGDMVDPEVSFVCEGCGEERGFGDRRPGRDWPGGQGAWGVQ